MASVLAIILSLLLCFAQLASRANAQSQTGQNPDFSTSSGPNPKPDIIEPTTVPPPSSPDPNSPLNDDFFKPPAGFEKTAPGTVLRYRKVPKPIKFLPGLSPLEPGGAWQLLYRTQNSVGKPEANIVTVLVPYKPLAKNNHLFSFSYFSVRLLQPIV